MQIFSVTLTGFGRFAQSWMNLDSKVVAIIGPNEAGKSTLLRALQRLSDDSALAVTDVTRGMPSDQTLIQARFRISKDELKEIGDYDPSTQPAWFIVEKRLDGIRSGRLVPTPRRNPLPFTRAIRSLGRVKTATWFTSWANEETSAAMDSVLEAMRGPDEISDELQSTVARLAGSLGELAASPGTLKLGKNGSNVLSEASSNLGRVVEVMQESHPATRADALISGIPPVVEFAAPARRLKSAYNLDDDADRGDQALAALVELADLDLVALRSAIAVDDALAKSMLEDASGRLTERLRDNWKQVDDIEVSLGHQGVVLQIFVRTEKRDYFQLETRSEGLRAFVSLLAFSSFKSSGVKPVLLVDEAEAHLHYDAQADLVRVFERQTAAANVIFTTHSVGCMPQDLSRGVRVVEQAADANRSVMRNAWWNAGKGLRPLAFALGARALSLVPTRYAVFTEGATDPMIMPTLLRDATDLETLPYQLVPGLAEATDAELRSMLTDAPHVGFLVDGDASGGTIAMRLLKIGVPGERIVSLGADDNGEPLVPEDLVESDRYAAAVNEEITSWKPSVALLDPGSIPAHQRPRHVEEHLAAEGEKGSISKVQIAAELIEAVLRPTDGDTPALLDPLHKKRLLEIHSRLWHAVGLSGDPVAPA